MKIDNEKNHLLHLAKLIKHDFDYAVTLEFPQYAKGGRYKELMEMIAEIESGELKDHEGFDCFTGMDCDELGNFACLQMTMTQFMQEFKYYRIRYRG